MNNFFEELEKRNVVLPEDVKTLLNHCVKFTVFETVEQLALAAVGGKGKNSFEVKYDIPGKGLVTEAVVHKVTNGISGNYTEAYMRRRDPDTMLIADNLPSDKERFNKRFGYEFQS